MQNGFAKAMAVSAEEIGFRATPIAPYKYSVFPYAKRASIKSIRSNADMVVSSANSKPSTRSKCMAI